MITVAYNDCIKAFSVCHPKNWYCPNGGLCSFIPSALSYHILCHVMREIETYITDCREELLGSLDLLANILKSIKLHIFLFVHFDLP